MADKPPELGLIWDASASPDVATYRIYYAISPEAFLPGGSGPWGCLTVTNADAATIPGLRRGVTYYVAATAVASNGEESEYSNIVEWTAPGTVPPPPGIQLNLPGLLGASEDLFFHALIKTNGNLIHSINIFESNNEEPLAEGCHHFWASPSAGTYRFYAVAYYNHGFSVTSEVRVVYVAPPQPEEMRKAPAEDEQISLLSLVSTGVEPDTTQQACDKCLPFYSDPAPLTDSLSAQCISLLLEPSRDCCLANALAFAQSHLRQEASSSRPMAPDWLLMLPAGVARETLVITWIEELAFQDSVETTRWLRTLPPEDQHYGWPALKRSLRGLKQQLATPDRD